MSPALWFAAGFASCAAFVTISVAFGYYVARLIHSAREGYDPY